MVGESASKGSPFVRDKGTALTDNHPEVPGAKRDGLASGVKHKDPKRVSCISRAWSRGQGWARSQHPT